MLSFAILVGGSLTALTSYAASISAANVSYSNSTSGLSATNAQSAIDEIKNGMITSKAISSLQLGDRVNHKGSSVWRVVRTGNFPKFYMALSKSSFASDLEIGDSYSCAQVIYYSIMEDCASKGGSEICYDNTYTSDACSGIENQGAGIYCTKTGSSGTSYMNIGIYNNGSCKTTQSISYGCCFYGGTSKLFIDSSGNKYVS